MIGQVKGDTRAGLQLARQYNIDCVEGDSRSFRRVTRETANDVHQLVTGVGRVAEAFRVSLQSDPGGAAQGSYEGRLTTARETMSTV